MNSSTAICSVRVFKDSFWLPVASVISYSLGCLVIGSWFVGIWKDVTNPQKFWTIFSILKAWNKILVSSNHIITWLSLVTICLCSDGNLGIRYRWNSIASSMDGARRFWLLLLEQSSFKFTYLYDVSFTQFDDCLQVLCPC